jgi:hypothetical protein
MGTTIDRRTRLRLTPAAAVALLLAAVLITLAIDRLIVDDSGGGGAGSGVAASQSRALPPFTGIELAGFNNVIVRVGAPQSVVVHADDNLLARVTTSVSSGRLVIGTTPGKLSTKAPMWVDVSLPALDALALPGSGNFSVTGISGDRLTVALSGQGNIDAAGTTGGLDVSVSGQGAARLAGLTARDAHAVLGGQGTIVLTATERLDAVLSGTGTIVYGGNPPHVTRQVSGIGTIAPG